MFSKLAQVFKSTPKLNQQMNNPIRDINHKYYSDEASASIKQLFSMGKQNTSLNRCIGYYQQCAPLFSGIQLIADEIATINPYLYNKKTSEYIRENPILELLSNPNMDVVGSEFIEQIVCYFLITGNCFIMATGAANKPALELFVIPPQYVTLAAGDDGFVESMTITSDYLFNGTFIRKEVDGRLRFYCGEDKEIWHIKEFNPMMGPNNLYGMPKIMPIFYEIEQYINASSHNLSLLRRGARPSGAMVSQETLSDDQYMRLSEQMDRFYVGANQSGRVMLLENGIDFKEMSITNKDMDFMELKKNVTNTIYNALKIPLPIISPDHMTMSNMDIAKLNLYDNAVLPLTDRIFTELTNFLLHRYTQDKNIIIDYSEDEIIALQPRRSDDLVKIKEIGVLTANEIRKEMGYEALQGGNTLYGTTSEIPVAEDIYTADEPKIPAPMDGKDYLIGTLRKQQSPDGTPKYSEARIKEIVGHYYGYNS